MYPPPGVLCINGCTRFRAFYKFRVYPLPGVSGKIRCTRRRACSKIGDAPASGRALGENGCKCAKNQPVFNLEITQKAQERIAYRGILMYNRKVVCGA